MAPQTYYPPPPPFPDPLHTGWNGKEGDPMPPPTTSTWPFLDQATSSPTAASKTVDPPPAAATTTYAVIEIPDYNPPHQSHGNKPSISNVVFGAAGAIAAVIGVFLVIAAIIFCCRRQRKRRAAQAAAGPQVAMKNVGIPPVGARTYIRPPNSQPPLTLPSSSTSTSTSTTSIPPTRMPEPVILPTNNESYFTGIDTSDQISLAGQTTHSSDNIYPSGNEEPPPPYRPRSVPPISRESSLRVADGMRPNFGSFRNSIRSPFNDPVEEDADIEGDPFVDPNQHDNVSVVSDLSYQREPTSTYSTI